ncbi:MAG: helix-turn-helix domain-containing protein [Lachnospiraceae bacterium]
MGSMELLANALEYLETHLEEDVRTEDVARECYCSKSTLEKLFQCVNHISVHEYLVRRRMTKAARLLLSQPELGILQIALQFGYSTNESFTRAFKQVWNCNPSEFRATTRFTELFPRLRVPDENGDEYVKNCRQVDISELYDLFVQRKGCYFICCDIKNMIAINDVSRKAGDIAILTSLQRMNDAAGEEDVVFRIGGDEFALLTNSSDITYAEAVAEKIRGCNGQPVLYEGAELPLNLYVSITKLTEGTVRYHELFSGLHKAIEQNK